MAKNSVIVESPAKAKNLVIVESPAKARTMSKYLGSNYSVKASMGHVRDLPAGKLGVEVEDNFDPHYVIMADKKKIVKELKEASKNATAVYLATDSDREGEAISWHLVNAANLKDQQIHRVTFHEITKEAIQDAFNNPRDIDIKMVNAQQARRILDRLVGYRLSPLLWKKVRPNLSAGRVQSVALRIIIDRETEIQKFVTNEYWTISVNLLKDTETVDSGTPFKATLNSIKGQKETLKINNEQEANLIKTDLTEATYQVVKIVTKESHNKPAPPFITSTLQQDASRKLRFSSRRTMQIAQQLYEGLSVGTEGEVGLITYMRTDSTNMASSALKEAKSYIISEFGKQYAPTLPRVYAKKVKGAQEAHEAIRPTSIKKDPDSIRSYLTSDQYRLYQLIWKRTLASQMTDAISDVTTIEIEASHNNSKNRYIFSTKGTVLKFPGFRILYIEGKDDSQQSDNESPKLPPLVKEANLTCLKLVADQRFTQPPNRYTEAGLIKILEEQGIGRPSTYAPIISTIQDRNYVEKTKGHFTPTKLGTIVCNLLTTHFPEVMSIDFTAGMEKDLDRIAQGEEEWVPMLRKFYEPFDKAVEKAIEEAERIPRSTFDEETDEICDKCESKMVIKTGRFGKFLACSAFPECRNAKPIKTGVECPECKGDLVERRQKGKRGKIFYGCSNYPSCNFALNQKPLTTPCPDCGGLLSAYSSGQAKCTKCEFKGRLPEPETLEVAV